MLPAVSCVCMTYGRPSLLEEAIWSFLIQDYGGPKELVVLNDCVKQRLTFAHPDVRIINLPKRFRTVGEKCNAAVALAKHDILFVWDDDDIYLPRRLSFSVEHFDSAKGFFKPQHAWVLDGSELSGPTWNTFHVGSCWSRELFDAARGYAAMGNGYDQEIEARFEDVRPDSTATFDIDDRDIYYIYRWNGTGSYHMSAIGQDAPGGNLEQAAVSEYVDAQISNGSMAEGELDLSPHWSRDYFALIKDRVEQKR